MSGGLGAAVGGAAGSIASLFGYKDDDLEQALTRYGRTRVETAFTRHPDNRMYASLDAYLDHWPIRHVRAGLPPTIALHHRLAELLALLLPPGQHHARHRRPGMAALELDADAHVR